MRVLAGDIGGTKTWLQLADFVDDRRRPIAEERYESAAYDGLLPIIREFLHSAAGDVAPQAACFGIAGPVTPTANGQVARVTNLPWLVESLPIVKDLGIHRVRLINDFQAVAYAIETLEADDLIPLQIGERQRGAPCAVIGAGTGLGQALLAWQGDSYDAIATEGGHVDFAPTSELQIELLRYLAERYGRVSYERILSGPGLVNLYTFFSSRERVVADGELLLASPDTPAAISAAALLRTDEAAEAALRLFLEIYGAFAGNVALSYLAAGGVFIAGGIAPKILPALLDGTFIRAFVDKGRMSALVGHFPVHVIVNEKAGLHGAAWAASRL